MSFRAAVLAVLLAAAGPGLLFAPVFGVAALVLPLLVVVVTGFAVVAACERWPALVPWRPVLALVVGLLGLVELLLLPTTVAGLPTGDTVRALAAGLTDSWQLTLQSTWPARPDPELLLFVPLATLAAAVLGTELLVRLRWPLVALVPGLAVVGLSQAYVALTGLTAMLAAFCFAVLAAILLAATDHTDAVPTPADRPTRRSVVVLVLVVPTLVLSVAGAVLATSVHPTDRPAYSLRDKQFAPLPPERVASPLDELADRMQDPDEPVFTYSTNGPVDRWRLVVLDSFNGVNWTPSAQPRRLGTMLTPDASVTVSKTVHSARVSFPDTAGPWLPSQALPASVTGPALLVDEASGTLLAPGRTGAVDYDLSWWDPQIAAADLGRAAIDPTVRIGSLGEVPDGIIELAGEAVRNTRPAFQTALVLQRFLRDNYTLATDADLPSGSGWPQLSRFLLEDKRGTTEQFAAAYVVLARIIGLPARIAVGYRAPGGGAGEDVVVHNSDALAWPEVAVEGVGWVPLDPGGAASGSGGAAKSLAEVAAEASDQLPPPADIEDPALKKDDDMADESGGGNGFTVPVAPIVVGVAVLLVVWLVGVPLVRTVRGWRRRRRPGAGAVVGAWAEARDRLRAHGIPFTAGMTVRDLAGVAAGSTDAAVVTGLHDLARSVDVALWSGAAPAASTADEAWSAVRAVRRGLARAPLPARLRAALNVRTLLPPRP